MSATSVKYFSSTMPGAPVLSGTAGALIAVLDACLVTGLGLKTVDSLVVFGGAATMNISTGHSAVEGGVVNVSGASPAGLNGDKRVVSVTTNTIVFDATGISNTTATGTITTKVAPAGWTKEYGNATVAAYRGAAGGTQFYLRVDDTGTVSARVLGYEGMTDVNSGTNPFPTEAMRAGGGYWPKSDSASTAARPWILVADDRGFYLNVGHQTAYLGAGPTVFFGDVVSLSATDTYQCGLQYMGSLASVNYATNYLEALGAAYSSPGPFAFARSYTGAGSSILACVHYDLSLASPSSSPHVSGSSVFNYAPYPNPTDGSLSLSPFRTFEAGTFTERGNLPGLYGVPQAVPDGVFNAGDAVSSSAALPGHLLRAVKQWSGGGGSYGIMFIDTTGPWR